MGPFFLCQLSFAIRLQFIITLLVFFSPRNASERFAPNVFDSRESEIAERNFEHCGQLKNCCVFQSEDTLKFLRVM